MWLNEQNRKNNKERNEDKNNFKESVKSNIKSSKIKPRGKNHQLITTGNCHASSPKRRSEFLNEAACSRVFSLV